MGVTTASVFAGCASGAGVFAGGSAGSSAGGSGSTVLPLSCATAGSSHTLTGLGSSSDGYVKFTEMAALISMENVHTKNNNYNRNYISIHTHKIM